MNRLRGGAYEFHIKGLDELLVKHDSVMLEACNASFQVHFQVGAKEFPSLYNIAQLVAAPVLAVAVNSPMLFGRQLWMETRIALFQQAVDTRSIGHHLRERSPRVTFGRQWVRRSVLELYQEDVARFRALVGAEVSDEDSIDMLDGGVAPNLKALMLHNGTVYRWNRACYGLTDGKPHLRIENRVLPSGPTVIDEIANAAFWFGLISQLSHEYPDISEVVEFEDAKVNFRAAARLGMASQLNWIGGETLPANELVLRKLLPAARLGLERGGIVHEDIERYLSVIEERVRRRQGGSRWQTRSYSGMRALGSPGERLNALTAAIVQRQRTGRPVAEWELARLEEGVGWKNNFLEVEQYMTTDLFTVLEDEPLDLVASLMEWERIRHVPVEDHEGRLVGLVSYRALLRLMARGELGENGHHVAVSEVMKRNPVTVSPETSTLESIDLMRRRGISCLPVVKEERLIGIVTERDFMNLASELLEQKLRE
jgi:CBS domain-containing protein